MKKICFIPTLIILAITNIYAESANTQLSRKASARIVGGHEAERGAWPWIAELIYSYDDSYYDGLMCAGSLIHPRWVITAAHCVEDMRNTFMDPEDIDVVLGLYDLKNDTGERVKVKNIIPYPGYDRIHDWNADLALLELEEEMASYPTVPLVKKETELDGKEAIVIGWGTTSATRSVFPEKLHQASVMIVSNEACNESFNQDPYYDDPITEFMMCAGFSEGGTDACQDDSGGPLVVQDGDIYRLAGLVSWGEGCGLPGYYGVYTRIPRLLDFIYDYVPKPNEPPVASDDHYIVNMGTGMSQDFPGVLENDSDPDADSLTAILVSDVSQGTLTLNSDGSFIYKHDGSETSADSFSYKANDGNADSDTARVTIDVNHVPTAANDSYLLNAGEKLSISAPGVLENDSDPDSDTLTALLVSDVSQGTLILNSDGSFIYKHDGSQTSADSFSYKATDGNADSDTARVTIDVNHVPTAANDSYSLNAGKKLNISAPGVLENDEDTDNDALTASLDSGVSHGTLTLNPDGSFIYEHDGGEAIEDSFTYRTSDRSMDSEPAKVTFEIHPVKDGGDGGGGCFISELFH
jgi:VCBS repeat-containing protein